MNRFLILIVSLITFRALQAQESRMGNADDSLAKIHINEELMDSIWRRECVGRLGAVPVNKTDVIVEFPQWARWKYNLERYFVSQMRYPEDLLKMNWAGYSVMQFTLDTLGLPRDFKFLNTVHEEFDNEALRLMKELPHCLPCRDGMGRRMECYYTVYVPFLPQHYRDRVVADSIRDSEEELGLLWVTYEIGPKFRDGKESEFMDYIYSELSYDPKLLGEVKAVRGLYSIYIDSYGEVFDSKVIRSCGIQEWDEQVLQIARKPRWQQPFIITKGNGEYRKTVWSFPVIFRNDD